MSVADKEWKIIKNDFEKVSKIASSLPSISKIASILVGRGIDTVEKVEQFIDGGIESLHNPFLFSDMCKAVSRIRTALELHENILVYGDKDVDGITAVSIIVNTIRLLGGNVEWYVPADEGYGIHNDILSKYAAKNVKILITVDCGISAVEGIAYAKSLGMYVILTDHHEPPYEGLPKADAIINPKVCSSKYPFKQIAGCVVSLKVMHALMLTFCKEYDKEVTLCFGLKNDSDFCGSYICLKNDLEMKKADFKSLKEIKDIVTQSFRFYTNAADIKEFLVQSNALLKDKIVVISDAVNDIHDLKKIYKVKKLDSEIIIKEFFENNLDLCSLGIIADSVPLIDENRIIVKKGLKIMEKNPHAKPGLGLLLDDALFSKGIHNITAKLVLWSITPVLNSSGRMAKGMLSAKLLMTKDIFQAKNLYSDIVKLNENRKCLQSTNMEQFKHLLEEQCNLENDNVLIVKALNLEHGVTGIVASQMVKTYSRPAFLFISDGREATGAARSVAGFDVVAALENVKDILIKYGGHNQAAGFTLEDSKIEEFTRRISEYADKNLKEAMIDNTFLIEGELKISDIVVDFYNQVEVMEPFGVGNLKPVFCIRRVAPTEISVFGNRNEHLKFKIS
ncbi:MAG: single-stranded-DNA-specific exonuclease RecJ, partial [Endomicrobium sp.]|uniref:single-stranded-DNA-specific exonuclease RecJ n=1 Tax=Candidatus Endomicrobiellum pyrsonymphae TaxID=1408203 RepID=UPI00357480DC|nr:single-stranded-DNA-specific exonuclease RecJ [Endomicrobium sp.]